MSSDLMVAVARREVFPPHSVYLDCTFGQSIPSSNSDWNKVRQELESTAGVRHVTQSESFRSRRLKITLYAATAGDINHAATKVAEVLQKHFLPDDGLRLVLLDEADHGVMRIVLQVQFGPVPHNV